MGLKFTDTQSRAVRRAARYLVEQYEQRKGDREEDERLIEVTFAMIAQAAGDETANVLFTWGSDYVPHEPSEGAAEFIWTFLLQKLAGLSGAEFELVPLGLSPDKQAEVIQIIRQYLGDDGDVIRLVEEAEQQPKSAWDEPIFQAYEALLSSPMDWVINTIGFHSFRQAWERIKPLLSGQEMAVLWEWAKEQAPRMGIPTQLVGLPS